MMYMSLTAGTLDNQIPTGLVDKYGYSKPICDENTIETGREDVHPTWRQLINRGDLGEPKWNNDQSLCVVKLDLSMLSGEIASAISIGVDMTYPNNSLLNDEEYESLINNGSF